MVTLMADSKPSDVRQQQLTHLNSLLEMNTIQQLRQAARLWNWPLRGTAKAEIVGQMLAYLSDPVRMAEAFRRLPEDEQAVLQWLKVLQPPKPVARTIQAALEIASDRKITQKGIDALIEDLVARCLAFPNDQGSYVVPELYEEWLSGLAADELRYTRQPVAVPSFTLADLSNHIHHFLLNVRADRPVITFHRPAGRSFASTSEPAIARPSAVATPTLNAWGYLTREERNLANFLLETLLLSGICQLEIVGTTQILRVKTPDYDQVLEKDPDQQLQWLRQVWLTKAAGYTAVQWNTWTELDLALQSVPSHFQLYSTAYWSTQEQLVPIIARLRGWLTSLVSGLEPDVWYSVESFCTLVYRLRRNLLVFDTPVFSWNWYRDGKPLDPTQMSFEDWQVTYGKLIEAWLRSTATWLLIAEVGYEGGRPVAFRRYAQIPVQENTLLPHGAVEVTADDVVVIKDIPRTGRLRQIFSSIATQAHHSREATTYRLDPIKFRQLLLSGFNMDRLRQALADTGYILDERLASQLAGWQARIGRQQIYERVAIIEFSQEMHPSEVAAAAASITVGPAYAVSSHCLVLLNPDQAQTAIAQLRQRGYTPRVIA